MSKDAVTTNEQTIDKEAALTKNWKTQGLEDCSVEGPRTVTMSQQSLALISHADELVNRLPRLLQDSDRQTAPELRLLGTLGEGGMGLVTLAEQLSVGRQVAVKKVHPDSQSDRSTLVLLREGWTTGLLEHPNIVPIYTLGRDDEGQPVIVMKKIEGISWLEIIEDPKRAPEAFDADDPEELHLEILIQICNAVHYAHSRGIIHRDLKPENIMLGEFGEVYVLDWGIAVSIEDDPTGRLASAKDVTKPAGTPAYMAPEMVGSEGCELGTHTDVFLLGAVLYEALTGHPPYSGNTLFAIMLNAHDCEPPTFDDSVPEQLQAICRRAMARDPEDRFESARDLRDALNDYRRRRESRRLATQGEERLQEVQRLLEREDEGQKVDETELYRLFGECRFAYEQSLQISPKNPSAVDGLQTALEAMADRALKRDAQKAASLLIADFPKNNDAFEERLQELESKLRERRQDYKELQQIRRDVDPRVGQRGRALFILVMGLMWTAFAGALALTVELGIFVPTTPLSFVNIIFVTIILGVFIYAGRNKFFENELNRRVVYSVFAIACGSSGYRGLVWMWDLPIDAAIGIEMMTYGMAACLLAIAFERRIFFVAAAWVGCALIGSIWTVTLYWVFAAACALTVIICVWMWWPHKSSDLHAESAPY